MILYKYFFKTFDDSNIAIIVMVTFNMVEFLCSSFLSCWFPHGIYETVTLFSTCLLPESYRCIVDCRWLNSSALTLRCVSSWCWPFSMPTVWSPAASASSSTLSWMVACAPSATSCALKWREFWDHSECLFSVTASCRHRHHHHDSLDTVSWRAVVLIKFGIVCGWSSLNSACFAW